MMEIKSGTRLFAIAVTTALIITWGNTGLLAQPHGMGPMNGKGPGAKLKFDDEQKAELKKLGEAHKEKMKTLRDETQKMHDELFSLLKDSQPDQTKAESIISSIAENRKKMDTEMFNHLTDIKNLCKTDEQRKLFGEFVDDFSKMHGPMMGPPPMEPPPPPEDK